MIIFKLISTEFKQNLGPGVQNFILRAQKKLLKTIYIYIYIYKLARSRGSFEPLGLKVTLPLRMFHKEV